MHGSRLYNLLKDKCVSGLGGKFLYDDDSGSWCNTDAKFTKIVYKHEDVFTTAKFDKASKEWVFTYTKSQGSMYEHAMKHFWTLVPDGGVLDCKIIEVICCSKMVY